jgi:hypothetical protein
MGTGLNAMSEGLSTPRLGGIGWAPSIGENYSDEWYTPKWILQSLGRFDLDPCGVPHKRTAIRTMDIALDGMSQPWEGRVWLNPPYSEIAIWMMRMAHHHYGTALVFARTETEWFHASVWEKASACLFLRGRVSFERPDGTTGDASPSPSVLVAYGPNDARLLGASRLDGAFVDLRKNGRPI